jgi:AcrR family transcriptional regulator
MPRKPTRTSKPRSVDPADHRKADLRHAAYQLFRDQGYDTTTVDDICAQADSSKGAFYWHYESKQDVFLDILEAWTREITDQILTQFQQAVRADDAVAATTQALERELRRGRVIVPLWLDFTVHARNDPKVREALQRFYRRARMAIAEILRPGLGGLVDEEALQSVAATVFGGYCGLMLQQMVDPEGADARRAVQQFMGVLGKVAR